MDPKKQIPSPRELELLALVGTGRIGREVVKLYEKETGRQLPYGTAYTLLDDMAKAGWISSRDDVRSGRRVRIFRIKGAGSRALDRGREYYLSLAQFGTGWPSRPCCQA